MPDPSLTRRSEDDLQLLRAMMRRLHAGQDVRIRRVRRMRARLRMGHYESPMKLEVVMDKLLDDALSSDAQRSPRAGD